MSDARPGVGPEPIARPNAQFGCRVRPRARRANSQLNFCAPFFRKRAGEPLLSCCRSSAWRCRPPRFQQARQHQVPHVGCRPAAVLGTDHVPVTELVWQVTPRRTCPRDHKDAVQNLAVIQWQTVPLRMVLDQERFVDPPPHRGRPSMLVP